MTKKLFLPSTDVPFLGQQLHLTQPVIGKALKEKRKKKKKKSKPEQTGTVHT